MATLVTLRRLGEETFGQKLTRARQLSRIGLKTVADLVSANAMPVSFATVSRLERQPVAPRDPRRRMLAALVVLAYGFDPADFELSRDDIPRSVDLERFLAIADEMRPKHTAGSTGDQGDSGYPGNPRIAAPEAA